MHLRRTLLCQLFVAPSLFRYLPLFGRLTALLLIMLRRFFALFVLLFLSNLLALLLLQADKEHSRISQVASQVGQFTYTTCVHRV